MASCSGPGSGIACSLLFTLLAATSGGGRADGLLEHQPDAYRIANDLVALVDALVPERHDPRVIAALRHALVYDLGADPDGVTVEDRLGELDLVEPEIAQRGALGGLWDGNAGHQAQDEQAVDQALPVDRDLAVLRV